MLGTLATIGLMAGLAATGGQVAGGFATRDVAKRQAGLQEEQARIALEEANVAATQKQTEQRKFLAEQRMAYLASGVTLTGTPGIVGADTFNEFQMEIDAIRRSGAARFGLGMKEAAITKSSGRAQMLSGIFSGVGTAATSIYSAGSLSSKTTPSKITGLGKFSSAPYL